MLALPTPDGNIDFNYSFIIDHQEGVDFLNRVWDYFWQSATFKYKTA